MNGISPADSAAVVTHVQGFVGPFVQSWLAQTFQGISPEVAGLIAKAATGVSTITALACVRWLMIGFAKGSEVGRSVVAPIWDRNRGWLNPLLALILGHLDGSALVGMAAVALHAGVRGVGKAVANTTPQDVARVARNAGAFVILLVGLAWAAGAQAGAVSNVLRPVTRSSLPVSFFAKARFAFTLAAGAKTNGWSYSRGTQGFAEAQFSWQWTNAVGVRAGVRRIALAGAPYEPEAKVTLTFAP